MTTSQPKKSTTTLLREVDKLLANPELVSYSKQPGWSKCANGSWWAPGTLERVEKILTDADAADGPPYLALLRRASARMIALRLDEALADLVELESRGSQYAGGILALQLHRLRGDEPEAQKYLDEINAENKRKGLPKQKFSDFRL